MQYSVKETKDSARKKVQQTHGLVVQNESITTSPTSSPTPQQNSVIKQLVFPSPQAQALGSEVENEKQTNVQNSPGNRELPPHVTSRVLSILLPSPL